MVTLKDGENSLTRQYKIAILIENFDKKGGSERRTYELVKRLKNNGHDITVFANSWSNTSTFEGEGINFVKVPMTRWPFRFMAPLTYAYFANKAVKKEDFDIIHSQTRTYYQDVATLGGGCHRAWIDEGSRLKLLDPFHRAVLSIEKRQFQDGNYKRIIVNSKLSKNGILKFYPVPEDRIKVIHNGVDTERFNPLNKEKYRTEIRKLHNISDDDFVILYVGSGFKRKGVSYLIEAAASIGNDFINKNRIKLLIVGKDRLWPYKRLAAKTGIDKNIIFVDYASETEKYYAASDIFALPTFFDPFANVTLEAMASGLPVITTKKNGASEIIEDGKEGFIINTPLEIDALTEKIRVLLNSETRRDMADRAREKSKWFTWDRMTEETLKVYDEIRAFG
ncbi:MAG: glycosyltransferase family 4 protein [Nitrospirae bacterium]|nr:glycosyltransferase family 4 protein [Nitrospirota bacterium]